MTSKPLWTGRGGLRMLGGLARATHLYPNVMVAIATLAFGLVARHGTFSPDLLRVWLVVMCGHASIGLTNDYRDRELDRLTQPDKPIPAGLVRASQVRVAIIFLLTLGSLLALTLPPGAALLALVATAAGLLYDFRLKDSYLSWVPYMLSFSTFPLFVWAGLGQFQGRLVWLYPPALFLTVGINLANALPDIEQDRSRQGSQGLAHRLGTRGTLWGCWILFGLAPLLCIALSLVIEVNRVWGWTGCGLALGVIGLTWWRHTRSAGGPSDREEVWKLCCVSMLLTAVGWLGALALV